MTAYDSSSFDAGQDSGARIAACVARLAALELMDDSRWWNRWRHRLMARALVACAEEMETAADEHGLRDAAGAEGASVFRGAPSQRTRDETRSRARRAVLRGEGTARDSPAIAGAAP